MLVEDREQCRSVAGNVDPSLDSKNLDASETSELKNTMKSKFFSKMLFPSQYVALYLHIVLLCILPGPSDAVTATEMKTHLTNTFANYDTRVRPVSNQNNAVLVSVDFYLISINSFDAGDQKLETTAFMEIVWKDEVLQTDWSNAAVEHMTVSQKNAWLPDIALHNGFTSLSGLGNNFLNVIIAKNGTVLWRPYQVFDSACAIDVTFFPFDSTTCDIKFVIWSNPADLVLATKGSQGLDLTMYESNSEWTMKSVTATNYNSSSLSGVTFSLSIERKPLFYLLNIIIPVVMLAVMNCFVFALPIASGERIGFAVTAFLAFAVFLTIISSELPRNSEKISTFSAYLFLMTFVSTLITLITIVQVRLFHRDQDVPIPTYLQGITKLVRRVRYPTTGSGYNRGIALVEMKRRLTDDVTWENAMDALDFILFWLFITITTLVTIVCLAIAAAAAI